MLGKIFSFLIIVSFICAGISGKMSALGDAAISGADEAVKLAFSMLGVVSLWTGIMRVFDKAGITKIISRIIAPILKIIYPKTYKSGYAVKEIAADCSANMLGLGNAALPMGIKAMNSLKKDGLPEIATASDEMIMFAVINTAPFQLIPTTLIALRNAHSSSNSTEIILPIWISSILTSMFAVILCKTLAKLFPVKK